MINLNAYTWVQLTAVSGVNMDGVHAAFLNGKHRVWGGWTIANCTFNEQYESLDGIVWTQMANSPWTGRHTCAYTVAGTEVYMVNGDVFNYQNDGVYAKQSYKFDGTNWSLITSDNGLGGYSAGALHYLGGQFYFIGGQMDINPLTARNQVWVSTDNCVTFNYLTTLPFQEGFLVGNTCVFNGRIYKVGGTIYDTNVEGRTYSRIIWSSDDGINWVNEGKMPYAMRGRHYSQMVSWDGLMWLIGGYHGFRGVLNIAEIWASSNGKDWEMQQTPWAGRHACSAWVGPDGIYVGFGTIDPNNVIGDVWKLIHV